MIVFNKYGEIAEKEKTMVSFTITPSPKTVTNLHPERKQNYSDNYVYILHFQKHIAYHKKFLLRVSVAKIS